MSAATLPCQGIGPVGRRLHTADAFHAARAVILPVPPSGARVVPEIDPATQEV